MTRNKTERLPARKILNNLRDCMLVNWHWVTAERALTVTFLLQANTNGSDLAGRITLYLRGVTQLIFECEDAKESGTGYFINSVSLIREVLKGSGKTRYRLEVDGEMTLEAAGRTCEIMKQVPLTVADTETVEVEEVTLADVKKAFAELDVAFAELEAGRTDHDREMAEMQAETRANLRRSDKIIKEWQHS